MSDWRGQARSDMDVYAHLTIAWQERMSYIIASRPIDAQDVWGAAFRWWYPGPSGNGDPQMIEWRARPDGGNDCVVAGTMYFEDTAARLVRVPK